MSNPNKPFGFAVLQSEGAENRSRVYNKAASIMYPGDVVKMTAAGTADIAAAGDQVLGIVAAYQAAADATVKVYDDPNQDFFVQVDANFVAADVGQNANLGAGAGGDTSLKQSREVLAVATEGTAATLQFKIFGLYNRGLNAVGSYAIVRVKPQNHFFRPGATGV